MDNPLKSILNPRSIAFFGANDNYFKMGSTQLLNILISGYKGKIYPIHPRLKKVQGIPAYSSIEEIPSTETVDIFFIVLPNNKVPEVLESCGKRNITRGVIVTAGFRETGELELRKKLLEVVEKYNIKFLGPNCFGFFNNFIEWEEDKVNSAINTTWLGAYNPPNGGVSIASQSGTYMSHIFMASKNFNIGFSKTISLGNEATIDLVDALEYLENDDSTNTIGLYIEEIKRPKEFMKVASRITEKKPIVAMYVGGTKAGGRAIKSHTGSLAGNDNIFNAMAKQVGIIRVDTMEEWITCCHALSSCPIPSGNKLCILTNSGGPGASMADLSERYGIAIPEFSLELQEKIKKHVVKTAQVKNIIDLTFDFDITNFYLRIPKTVLKSTEVDGLLIYGIFGTSFFKRLQKLKEGIKFPLEDLEKMFSPVLQEHAKLAKKYNKPIIATQFLGREDNAVQILQDNGIPVFLFPHQAVKAFWALNEYRKILEKKKLEKKIEN
ncbi:MAG: acetate--CoA ligase family protein [Promethearchaeota archaeon]